MQEHGCNMKKVGKRNGKKDFIFCAVSFSIFIAYFGKSRKDYFI